MNMSKNEPVQKWAYPKLIYPTINLRQDLKSDRWLSDIGGLQLRLTIKQKKLKEAYVVANIDLVNNNFSKNCWFFSISKNFTHYLTSLVKTSSVLSQILVFTVMWWLLQDWSADQLTGRWPAAAGCSTLFVCLFISRTSGIKTAGLQITPFTKTAVFQATGMLHIPIDALYNWASFGMQHISVALKLT